MKVIRRLLTSSEDRRGQEMVDECYRCQAKFQQRSLKQKNVRSGHVALVVEEGRRRIDDGRNLVGDGC
ncbi:hypothetical protein U1Q18_023446 [Sarracenia purpurea var. burkii]